jgi:hypothetical protein
MRSSHWLVAALATSLVALACSSPTPMVADVPPGEPLPIDGLWLDTSINIKAHLGAGRMWADHDFTSGLFRNRKGQILGMNIRRVGPRRYEGFNPSYQAPYHFYLQDDGRLALLLETPLVYKAFLVKISLDDPAAFAAETTHPDPGLPWEDATIVAAQPAQADQTPELADIRKSGHEGGDFLFVPKEAR